MEHPFTFFEQYIPGVTQENLFLATSVFVAGLLVLMAAILYPRLRNASANVIPKRGVSLQSIMEVLVETMATFCDDVIGHGGRKYLPYLGTLFIFILISNLIGMIPGFLPPTEVWTVGAALALISFITFNYYGLKEHGLKYFKHFVAPMSLSGIKNPFVLVLVSIPFLAFQILFISIESVSTLLRPIILTIRLTMNIRADHTVAGVLSNLVPYLIPIPFLILGVFVCLMQAFVFTMLSMVYISMATAHDH